MSQTNFAKGQLKSFVERVERLEEEKKSLAEDIREVFAEAKASGFDVKALRAVIRLRAQDAEERAEHEALVDLYKHALGMLADTPLGEAALENLTPHKKRRREPSPEEVRAAADQAEELADAE